MVRTPWLVVLVALAVMASEAPAEAYLDPGAGSIMLQVLLGGFAAAGVFAVSEGEAFTSSSEGLSLSLRITS